LLRLDSFVYGFLFAFAMALVDRLHQRIFFNHGRSEQLLAAEQALG
jgi:hypothetical protein